MRVPLSWLREYAPVPENATAEDVLATLVKVGLEEEDIHRPTDELSGPIVWARCSPWSRKPTPTARP